MYDVTGGAVELDGADVRGLNVAWLRSQIGYVGQEPVLFAGTIRENIALGAGVDVRDEAGSDGDDSGGSGGTTKRRVVTPRPVSESAIEAAARQAHAYDFITALPDGFDTVVGGGGGDRLSGGQRQRVCLARALVADPPILLADEATSALDGVSEAAVQAALTAAAAGRTTVLVAHRLSTVRGADAIAVVDGGRVVEVGSHAELMRVTGGRYRRMVEQQTLSDVAVREGGEGGEGGGGRAEAAARPLVDGSGGPPSGRPAVAADAAKTAADAAPSPPPLPLDTATAARVVRRAFRLAAPAWPWLAAGLAGSVGAGVAYPTMGILYADVLVALGDTADAAAASDRVDALAAAFVALGAAAGLATYAQSAALAIAGEALTVTLRRAVFAAALRAEAAFFDAPDASAGAVATQLAAEVPLVRGLTGEPAGAALMVAAAVGTGVAVAAAACWPVALLALAFMPGMAAGGALQLRALTASAVDAADATRTAGGVLTDAVAHRRTVAAVGAQRALRRRFDQAIAAPVAAARRAAVVAGAGMALSVFCIFALFGATLWVGARLTASGAYDFPAVLRSLTAVAFAFLKVGQAVAGLPDGAAAVAAAARAFDAADRASAIDATAPRPAAEPAWTSAEQRLADVVFRYPSRPDAPVLGGLSLTAPAGATVALVGPSGCGKSTVLALLQRLYDPAAGAVTHGGDDVRAVHPAALRSRLAVIPQEPELFSTTFRDNIAYGVGHAPATAAGPPPVVTDAAVVAAATAAGAAAFIAAAGGYDAPVGDRGSALSGGERQRIAVARALVRAPAVLLADEATSALDGDAEAVVAAALAAGAGAGRTTVLAAHRLATVASANVIAVVVDGVVVEVGGHAELLAGGGCTRAWCARKRRARDGGVRGAEGGQGGGYGHGRR
ncbi:hypothetical protein BU14_0699s0001 [Porphyra umbilicalis]|nr:hypothetical protein BU14_0699s0001 [Porphyra umbilicalis]|eukprot:OSX70647.1 hypothetical protein BU14_0699s0001 [Porphyra umbilicalis]